MYGHSGHLSYKNLTSAIFLNHRGVSSSRIGQYKWIIAFVLWDQVSHSKEQET